MIFKNIKITLFLLAAFTTLSAQESPPSPLLNKLKSVKIKPVLGLQIWSTYTFGTKLYDEQTGEYLPVENRLNTQIRRSRAGFKGSINKNISFKFIASLDLVGKDDLAGTEGVGNIGGSPNFRLWNAYLQFKVFPENEFLFITAGYLPPQIGRESITAALRSTSMEKSWSQNYLRRHLTNTGPGRAVGVNLGGRFSKNSHFQYDIGIFNPKYSANVVSVKSAPLFTGRLVTFIGEPEGKKYSIGHRVDYFNERKGLSVAIAAAHQGSTDIFRENYAFGGDFLLNMGGFNFDGEWTFLRRKHDGFENTQDDLTLKSQTGYLRLSYNISLKNERILEPVVQWMKFKGFDTAAEQAKAQQLNYMSGQEQKLDFGFNYYFNQDFKISLHYTLRNADLGQAEPGSTINNYFFQPGIGAIQRGDWLGLGIVAII